MRAAFSIQDVALMPCGPGVLNARALGETLELLAEARRLRPELRSAIVLDHVAGLDVNPSEWVAALIERELGG